MSRLQDKFKDNILPAVKGEFDIKNPMQLPKVTKICVSMGMGQYYNDVKKIEQLC